MQVEDLPHRLDRDSFTVLSRMNSLPQEGHRLPSL